MWAVAEEPSLTEKTKAVYDLQKGWSSRVPQPFPNLDIDDYFNIAKDAAPSLVDDMRGFCERNKRSYAVIPHEVFAETFEKQQTPITFRQWAENYCSLKNEPVPDIVIIAPRVKTLESSERKTGTKDPTDNPDYLAGMFVVMKGNGDRMGLDRLEKVKHALEHDPKTKADKDYYERPHAETGFRAYKGIWITTGAAGREFEGFGILTEIKLQHEDHMDVDNLTRNKIMAPNRQLKRWLFNMHSSLAPKQAAVHSVHAAGATKFITELGQELYNLAFEKSGLNRFLDPDLRAKHAPMEPDAIRRMILVDGLKFFQPRILQDLLAAVENSGVLSPTSATNAKSLNYRGAHQPRELELHV